MTRLDRRRQRQQPVGASLLLSGYVLVQGFMTPSAFYAAATRAEGARLETTRYLRGHSHYVTQYGENFPVERALQDVRVVTNSRSFRIWFTVLLGVLVVFRLVLCASILYHRKHTTMQLGQSSVLAVFVLAGAFCIGSCHLLMSISNIHCLLREPFIFTSLTLMGSILAARIWRISVVMSPVLKVGKSDEDQADVLKAKVLDALTILSDYEFLLEDAIKCRCKDGRIERRRKRSAIRQKIPIQQLVWLVVLMLIPQLTLQICNLSVTSLRSTLEREPVTDGIERAVCVHPVGAWDTWVGIALTVIPYALTVFLALKSDHLPSVFNEADAVRLSLKVFLLVICIAGPSYGLAESPDAQTYLLSCIVLGCVLPPCWFIVVSKVWPLWMGTSANLNVKRLLGRKSKSGNFIPGGVALDKNDEHGKSATLALTIGKMYEDMGMVQKSIALFDDALALWKWDPNRVEKDLIGGYTLNEINAFTTQDLEYIISLKIAQGRVNGTFNSSQNTGQKNAAQAWLDALEIYERAPASINMTDRSIIFPIFSGLFVFLKGDKIEQDAECSFEQNLVRKFVRETKLHGDPVHYTRALAMQGEVKARLGKYQEALAAFQKLKAAYIPEEHSEGISSAYGTDRSAQAFSQSAMWHMQLENVVQALEMCEYVIDELLPKMDPKNVLNSCELLLPIIRILKNRGEEKRMRRLFDEHVVQNFHRHFGKDGVTPCLPIFRPLLLLLDVCNDKDECPDITDDVEWLVEDEENGIPPDFLDSVYTKLCWSPNSMVAELCLRLAKMVPSDSDRVVLLEKGLKLAKKADRKMKDVEGKVKLPIAYEIHEPIYVELKSMAEMNGIEVEEDRLSDSFSEHSAHIDLHNLPKSYLRHQRTPSGRSTGFGTGSKSDSSRPDQPTSSTKRMSSRGSLVGSSGSLPDSSGRPDSSGCIPSIGETEEVEEREEKLVESSELPTIEDKQK